MEYNRCLIPQLSVTIGTKTEYEKSFSEKDLREMEERTNSKKRGERTEQDGRKNKRARRWKPEEVNKGKRTRTLTRGEKEHQKAKRPRTVDLDKYKLELQPPKKWPEKELLEKEKLELHHPERSSPTLNKVRKVMGRDKLDLQLPCKPVRRMESLELQPPWSVKGTQKTSWGCASAQSCHQSGKKTPRKKLIEENRNFKSVLVMFKEMENRKIKKIENRPREEEKEGKIDFTVRSSEANNERKFKPRNGSQTRSVIATKIQKPNLSSSKKKKVLGKSKSVNDIRKFFEIAKPSQVKSDLAVENSDRDGSCGIKAKNNTNQGQAKEHQQLPTPTQDIGLPGRCKVPRDSNNKEIRLKPSENEKQVRIPTQDAQDLEENTSVVFLPLHSYY